MSRSCQNSPAVINSRRGGRYSRRTGVPREREHWRGRVRACPFTVPATDEAEQKQGRVGGAARPGGHEARGLEVGNRPPPLREKELSFAGRRGGYSALLTSRCSSFKLACCLRSCYGSKLCVRRKCMEFTTDA